MDLHHLLAGVSDRNHTAIDPRQCLWNGLDTTNATDVTSSTHYHHCNTALGIDFLVEKLGFSSLQTMDARVVRIAPLASNEKHRHAHESIFVVIAGNGELQIGRERIRLQPGSVASIPRWITHQSNNISDKHELILLAITDFGLTSAVLGNYDARTRLLNNGSDAEAPGIHVD